MAQSDESLLAEWTRLAKAANRLKFLRHNPYRSQRDRLRKRLRRRVRVANLYNKDFAVPQGLSKKATLKHFRLAQKQLYREGVR